MTYRLITAQAEFDAVLPALADQPKVAIDTEFHREKTYYPQTALVQLAWPDGLVLVDPLVVDLTGLGDVIDSDTVTVIHAADQDLEVLERATGRLPRHLYDTQIAAGFLGMSSPSLATLHERFLGQVLPKGDRLTDWLTRPLSESQLHYAAADVEQLLALTEHLERQIEALGRVSWVADECEQLRIKVRGARDPEQVWRRIKEARQLKGRSLAIAAALAGWREIEAQERDVPPRYVLPDMAVVSVSQRRPGSLSDLKAVRGVESRFLRDGVGERILDLIREADESDPPEPKRDTPSMDRSLRPAVSLVSAWISQLSRDERLDPALLATRTDIEEFLSGGDESRLASGWRNALVGVGIQALVAGRASLAFGRAGELVLEARSSRPLE